ncbi:protein FAM3C [Paramormyrops kingsleyae]|uniref:FAM3 metabolism regulating signaling molecule D n=1 Tax=Paramormyrops kingsleyae TaxID=1676925 RepID=A0A3B3QQ12_9TELE|nr:protein FAM3D [Paramormyrops kingsleyae]
MRCRYPLRCGLCLIVVLLMWYAVSNNLLIKPEVTSQDKVTSQASSHNPKCPPQDTCSANQFAFYLKTGAANAIGPKICFDGKVVMSGVHNNIGHGLNIAVIDAESGKIEKTNFFNMYSGQSEDLLQFLVEIKPGMIVLVASFDDSATKMTDNIREIFAKMGSTLIKSLSFRDTWVFAGATGIEHTSTFEKMVKNDKATNTYDGWPEIADLGGCFPRKLY